MKERDSARERERIKRELITKRRIEIKGKEEKEKKKRQGGEQCM